MNLEAVLEGMLFIKGDVGLSLEEIKDVLEIDDNKLKETIMRLQDIYSNENRGIKIEVLGNKLKLVTKKEHKQFYDRLIENEDNNLTQASLETLAIIAYNEPITRIKIDEIRGVSSSHMIRKLIRMNLIKEIGKSDLPGRPNLYGTTDMFLDYFGLSSINELPKIKEIDIDDSEQDLFESK